VPSGTKENYENETVFCIFKLLVTIYIYLIYIMQELPTNK